MPKAVEEHLRAAARKKGYSGERADRLVYGTLNNMGMMHGNKPMDDEDMKVQAQRRALRRMKEK